MGKKHVRPGFAKDVFSGFASDFWDVQNIIFDYINIFLKRSYTILLS